MKLASFRIMLALRNISLGELFALAIRMIQIV